MSNPSSASIFAQQFLSAGPSLLVCLVACLLVGLEWRRGGRASKWAMLGFGLTALLVVGQVVWTLVSLTLSQTGGSTDSMRTLMPVLGLGLGTLHALAYGFLLMAVLAGRAPRPPGT